jgi:tetratricopeptide (TPR) repeat protein
MLALAALVSGCKPESKTTAPPPPETSSTESPPEVAAATRELAAQLAAARVDQARGRLTEKLPDEALALLVSALRADPASHEALEMAAKILAETVWNFPALTLRHPQAVGQLAFAAPDVLWVNLAGTTDTTVRWDLATREITSVLFPQNSVTTRAMVFGPSQKSVVIARGPVTLLCDARTLKPVRDLGPLPDSVTPTATVVFSPDGLLMAHPTMAEDKLVWHIRDVATGETLRLSDPATSDAPRPLAAFLDREKLRVLHADGSLMELPVSPIEPVNTIPIPDPVTLLDAQFSSDGNAALTLVSQGPHQPPAQSIIAYQDADDRSLELTALTERFPWNLQPNLWNGLMRDPETAPFSVVENSLKLLTGPHAPVVTASVITAAAFGADRVITGEENGNVIVHRLLTPPGVKTGELMKSILTPDDLAALELLCEALAGVRHDDRERTFPRLDAAVRVVAARTCDFDGIAQIFPMLDFAPVRVTLAELSPAESTPAALIPLWERLARADFTGKSWSDILTRSAALTDTPWHDRLTAAVNGENDGISPWLEGRRVKAIFAAGDETAIRTAIAETGGKGQAAATALALSLESEHPDWIDACLESATELPNLLRQIALSRAAWLRGQRAKALSPWPEEFPQMAEIRSRQDWQGWEMADFEPALEAIRQNVQDELVAIEIPDTSTPEQRQAVADRLADPETLATVGKPRFALACMKAALAFSAHKEDAETTFGLASTARRLGAPAEPCMRAEALALTAMGDYQKAHPIWIELITEHPLETQIPGDYAEAAYTAFENADPQQAMTILTTGMHRYPQDGNFALRAGWVALLTGNVERGYQFLQAGKRIGFPAEKQENALALLTIAAAMTSSYDDATVYFNDLVRLDPAWAELTTLDTLEWPDELKSVLGQFMH